MKVYLVIEESCVEDMQDIDVKVYGRKEDASGQSHISSSINYRVRFPAGGEDKFGEIALFATKQELLNSL